MAVSLIYLIRHGRHDHTGDLTDLGRHQAGRVATWLKQAGIRRLRCSTLARARQTAGIIAERLDMPLPRPEHLFVECLPGLPRQGREIRRFVRRASPGMIRASVGQARRAFASLTQGRRFPQAVVAHGNLIGALVCQALKLDFREYWHRFRSFNTGVTVLAIDDDEHPLLVTFNSLEHLPVRMRSL